ncbi:Hpt domain-containing protein [Kiloniella majae]|uniref:Hpt domain-containing protein n=1 Tax=Kiloniella majae TaxID=1938558 RepID=UPI000A27865D|nr:Hpt domain-containing protein [Kiloniella majae]
MTISSFSEIDTQDIDKTYPVRDELVIQALSNEVGEETIPFLVEQFRADLKTHLAGVIDAARMHNGEELQRESHTLKSVSGTFGALRLQEQMRLINESCRRGDHQEAIELAANADVIGALTMDAYQVR